MMKQLRTTALLFLLLGLSTALQCQKCSLTLVKMMGMSISDPESTEHVCQEITCAEGQDVCTHGYTTLAFSGEFPDGDSGETTEMTGEVMVDWFKDCGVEAESSCSVLNAVMGALVGNSDADIEAEKCNIETCDTDNCNDLMPTQINPNALKQINCYTCKKSLVNGAPNTDDSDPDQPTCSDDYAEACPMGTEFCMSGNLAATATVEGTAMEYKMEYVKGCGMGMWSSCDTFKTFMSLALGGEDAFKLSDCNIETCTDNLCNDKTAEEVAAYDGVPARTASVALIITTILAFLWAV